MRAHSRPRPLAGWLLVGLAFAGLPAVASAQLIPGGYRYGYGYSYLAPTPVVVPDYSQLRAAGQYYPPTVSGLQQLCAAQPQMCDDAGAQADLAQLGRRARHARLVQLGGIGGLLGGTGLVIWYAADSTSSPSTAIAGLSLLGAGLAAGVVGALLQPDRDDVRGVVNAINRGHPDSPVEWSLRLGPWGRGVAGALAATF